MYIKMTQTRRGSPDGHTVSQYHAGDIYEVPDAMGRRFVSDGWAEQVFDSQPSFLDVHLAAVTTSPFRPQPTRGSAPQNPATLSAWDGGGV